MKDEQIKERVKERYGKIALTGNSEFCFAPTEYCGDGTFIDEEEYYHNSLVYSGGSTLYKVRFTNYKNTILVVSFMQICLSNNIMYIHNIIPASCPILFYSVFLLSPTCTLGLIF
jgi:hypothetical protein